MTRKTEVQKQTQTFFSHKAKQNCEMRKLVSKIINQTGKQNNDTKYK